MIALLSPKWRPPTGAEHALFRLVTLLACGLPAPFIQANPLGGTVTQGSATFTSQGSQFHHPNFRSRRD